MAKLQAQLRKNVFEVLHDQENMNPNYNTNEIMKDNIDKIVINLIREYLSFHHLDYTLSIFKYLVFFMDCLSIHKLI